MSTCILPGGQLIEVISMNVKGDVLLVQGVLGDGRDFVCEAEHVKMPPDTWPFTRLCMLEKQAD